MSHEHHNHDHHHEEEGRGRIIKIVSAAFLLCVAAIIEKHTPGWKTWQHLLLYLLPYLIAGLDTLKEAAEALLHGEALDENFLMSVATLGALAIGFFPGAETQFPEAVFVMLFFQVGEMFEGIAEGKSRKAVSHLMDIRPDYANLEKDGAIDKVSPEKVGVGEVIVIRPGERVPIDGTVIEGSSTLDTSALTGESVPRSVREGGEILSGCVNLTGVLRVRTTKPFGDSTASRILSLVEEAAANKSSSEKFITRFAKVYTPVVVALALAVAILPPLLGGGEWNTWIYRGLMFLVVSCPCALVISIPLAFFGGIGGASRKGVLVKGAAFMDKLSKVRTFVFDKTGTLTEGVFEVTAVHPEDISESELLHLAAHVERHSLHPIAAALRQAYPDEQDDCSVSEFVEIAGKGLTATVNGRAVAVGNSRLMDQVGAAWHPCTHKGTIIHIAVDGVYEGHVVISDRIKEDALEAVSALRKEGINRIVMLTGDQEEAAAPVAAALGISEFHAGMLPSDKLDCLKGIISESPAAFVGDGINDAPVLSGADVGIAMGALGSDAAIEAADVVLMDDKPSKTALAVRAARKTLRIARENIWGSILIKVAVLILAGIGFATLWMAIFADVGVTVLAVLNAMRALRQE